MMRVKFIMGSSLWEVTYLSAWTRILRDSRLCCRPSLEKSLQCTSTLCHRKWFSPRWRGRVCFYPQPWASDRDGPVDHCEWWSRVPLFSLATSLKHISIFYPRTQMQWRPDCYSTRLYIQRMSRHSCDNCSESVKVDCPGSTNPEAKARSLPGHAAGFASAILHLVVATRDLRRNHRDQFQDYY